MSTKRNSIKPKKSFIFSKLMMQKIINTIDYRQYFTSFFIISEYISLTNLKYEKQRGFFEIFNQSIADYHIHDSIEKEPKNPYRKRRVFASLYQKLLILFSGILKT